MDNANLRGRGVVCKTYLPSFRGFGGPQGLVVMESVLHEVAVRCGLPPEKPFCPTDVVRCWDECLERADYQKRLGAIRLVDASNRWKKSGIAAVPLKFGVGFSEGFYNQGAALVNVYKDGSVLVSHGGTEMGQDINTKATQDACEKLMRRLQPLMEESPTDTWKQWVTKLHKEKMFIGTTACRLSAYLQQDSLWDRPPTWTGRRMKVRRTSPSAPAALKWRSTVSLGITRYQ
ncbi:aldehyde oxidase 3-like [Brachyistius frenatus]|uniref:aldehyde oxidase 3-like n=1 Tax=Brachyistius frenatus TaxID=100188 RepID=UPI0037E8EA12